MKYLENLKDFGIGLIIFISGVALLVQFVHWLVSLIL
jgi:hypothetical protein